MEFQFHVQHAEAFSGEKKRIFSIEIFGAEDGCTASSTDCTNLTMKAAAVIRRQWKTNGCGGNTHSRKKWEPKNPFPLFSRKIPLSLFIEDSQLSEMSYIFTRGTKLRESQVSPFAECRYKSSLQS